VNPARTRANYYLETAFSAASGSIPSNVTLDYKTDVAANLGFHETGWPTTLSLANDYSYDSALIDGAENLKMTIYYNGALVWGTEPL
jgi:mannan endo-1,4-beta-mannosidase